jgi:hypothetical protein
LPAGGKDQVSVCVEADQLLLLLKGISLRHVRRRKRYQHRGKIVHKETA